MEPNRPPWNPIIGLSSTSQNLVLWYARCDDPRSPCLGKVAKGIKCSVIGCKDDAVRSISLEEISRAGLKASASGRGYLCKNHYKELKKKLKKDKQIDQWRMKR
ncbi:MAG TPA: hypothetical protein VJL56_06995 [Candidatus Bathyarchaeia archaeon]|nr:hypothetical protein [Candidatus Bathyarchaeia archaeon]